jgi:hypothetical protein
MSDISNEEYAQAVEVSKLKQRIAELELAAKPASELAEKAAFWDYFCNRIPSMNREHLVTTYTDPWTLNEVVGEMLNRPPHKYRYPGNNEQLQEEAGRWADTYRGEGWMRIRAMLVDFHKHCRNLNI